MQWRHIACLISYLFPAFDFVVFFFNKNLKSRCRKSCAWHKKKLTIQKKKKTGQLKSKETYFCRLYIPKQILCGWIQRNELKKKKRWMPGLPVYIKWTTKEVGEMNFNGKKIKWKDCTTLLWRWSKWFFKKPQLF